MKFADKLFFATTFFLAVIFTIFGIGMLSSSFQKTLHRELEQADMENQMMQYLFEMAYQSMTEYGEEYAIRNAVESAVSSLEKNGIHCYIWSDEEVYYGGGSAESIRQQDEAWKLAEKLSDGNTFASGIRQLDEEYYLLSVCKSTVAESVIYLCISRDVTVLYRDRQSMLNQYRITLILLLAVGSAGIYLLSRYLTSPISNLDKVAGKIAAGDYEQRSKYHSSDEIGKLAENFNRMADRLVEQMKEKELEAKQKEDFTAAFAHELKTPLTSIIGYADMLNSVTLTEEERREAYFYIYTQGKRLESLSYKILELVSIEQNRFWRNLCRRRNWRIIFGRR